MMRLNLYHGLSAVWAATGAGHLYLEFNAMAQHESHIALGVTNLLLAAGFCYLGHLKNRQNAQLEELRENFAEAQALSQQGLDLAQEITEREDQQHNGPEQRPPAP